MKQARRVIEEHCAQYRSSASLASIQLVQSPFPPQRVAEEWQDWLAEFDNAITTPATIYLEKDPPSPQTPEKPQNWTATELANYVQNKSRSRPMARAY